MADPGLKRVLAELEATFDAAVAREEEEAAEDLAFSLLQDRSLLDSLVRSGPISVRWPDGSARAAVAVGRDYVACRGRRVTVVPFGRAVVVQEAEGCTPHPRDEDLVGLLRNWARRRVTVEIDTDCGPFSGVLVSAGPEHVVVDRYRSGYVTCPLGALGAISLVHEGSADGP